jgi:hypothetical protein
VGQKQAKLGLSASAERADRRYVALEAGVSRLCTERVYLSGLEGWVYGHGQLQKTSAP